MNIPNFENIQAIDKNGHWTEQWQLLMQQLFSELQNNLSKEGYKLPQQTTDNINILDNANSTGALIYDNTTHEFKVNINGEFKVVQVV